MSNAPSDSDGQFLGMIKAGDFEAAAPIWARYFPRLLGLARRKLAASVKRVADEEDVALSAFHSFCRGAAAGRFPKLDDRDDLWQVLAVIVSRKAGRQLERERAQNGRRENSRRICFSFVGSAAGIRRTTTETW